MSIENPTLKIRLAVPDSTIGLDCFDAARGLVRGHPLGYRVLDAKWGRTPTDWRATGGWGRTRLSDRDRGYVNGIEQVIKGMDQPVTAELIRIIRSLTQ